MKKLPDIMSHSQFQKFTENGYFTIRRTDKFCAGNFTDQTIEQILMRMIKAPGGLAHGRGITPSTQAKLVHVLPRCNALEDFCSVHTHTHQISTMTFMLQIHLEIQLILPPYSTG
jgi:predicted phosphodiesterase